MIIFGPVMAKNFYVARLFVDPLSKFVPQLSWCLMLEHMIDMYLMELIYALFIDLVKTIYVIFFSETVAIKICLTLQGNNLYAETVTIKI